MWQAEASGSRRLLIYQLDGLHKDSDIGAAASDLCDRLPEFRCGGGCWLCGGACLVVVHAMMHTGMTSP